MQEKWRLILVIALTLCFTAPLAWAAESIDGDPAQQLAELNGLRVYFVDIYSSHKPNNAPALDYAKKICAALLSGGVANVAQQGSNIYISFTGLESVRQELDACTFAVALGAEFPRQNYANLYYLAVDSSGNIYAQNSDSCEWEHWQPNAEIESGVFYAAGSVQTNSNDQNIFLLVKTAWEKMKGHGAPGGTSGRNIIFRYAGLENFNTNGLYVFSVELDYGDGAQPLFRVGVNSGGDVVCDAGGNGWTELPYGDLFGAEKAVMP